MRRTARRLLLLRPSLAAATATFSRLPAAAAAAAAAAPRRFARMAAAAAAPAPAPENKQAAAPAAATKKRGAFILFEGLDRSGKTTQSKRLFEWLQQQGHHAKHMRFPDRDTEIGKMIDAYLRNKANLDDRAIHLLFAANRWEASTQLRELLESGVTIVCDRYSFSGVAFSAAKGLDLEWCFAPERGLPAPDIVFFMELSAEEQAKRGGYGEERYEKKEMQAKVAQMFNRLKGPTWQVMDASRTLDALFADISKKAVEVVAKAATSPIGTLAALDAK